MLRRACCRGRRPEVKNPAGDLQLDTLQAFKLTPVRGRVVQQSLFSATHALKAESENGFPESTRI